MKNHKNKRHNILLREARIDCGWSQKEVADRLSTTVVTISRWEQGVQIPHPHMRQQLCALFSKSSAELGFRSLAVDTYDDFLCDPALPDLNSSSIKLIGREHIISELLHNICASKGSFAVTGLPGVGKTALSITLAHHPFIKEHFPDGVLWAGLSNESHLLEIYNRWSRVLQFSEQEISRFTTLDAWAKAIHSRLKSAKMLLIIDDAWHIFDAKLLKLGGDSCAHLLTTRLPHLAHEFAATHVSYIQELDVQDSLSLLTLFVPHAVQSHTSLFVSLIQRLGGLPLALHLVGRYLRVQELLGQPRRLLTSLHDLIDQPALRLQLAERHIPWEHTSSLATGEELSLQQVIRISEQTLPHEAQQALKSLSLFPCKPQSFSEQAALFVCQISTKTLYLLIDRGFIELDHPDRLRIHQTISDYAGIHSLPDDAAKSRLISFILTFVQDNQANIQCIEQELFLIETALNYAYSAGQYTSFLRVLFALLPFLEKRYLYELIDTLLAKVHQIVHKTDDTETLAYSHLCIGKIAESRAEYQAAADAYQDGFIKASLLHQDDLILQFLVRLGTAHDYLGNYTLAQTTLAHALQIAQHLHQYKQQSYLFKQLGEISDQIGQSLQADQLYTQAYDLACQQEQWDLISALLQNQGVKATRSKQYNQAEKLYKQGLKIARTQEDTQRESALLMCLGILYFHLNQYTKAISFSKKSLALAEKMCSYPRMSATLQNLGLIERHRGNLKQAEVYLHRSLQLALQIKHQWLIVETQGEINMLLLSQGKIAQAHQQFTQMLQSAISLPAPLLQAHALFGLAQSTYALGHTSQAMLYAQQSQHLFQTNKDHHFEIVNEWLTKHQP